jgi:S1-C subfamily serine protease
VTAPAPEATQTASSDSERGIDEGRRDAIVLATRKASPAVVSITVIYHQFVRVATNPLESFFSQGYGRTTIKKQPYEILGSGVIIDKRGYIITNNHVLGESKDSHIFITLSDGRQFQAELVGRSTHYDVALLRFSEDVPDMPVATLGDSDDLVPGEWAIAIGSPYRYLLDDPALTVTVGVISALHRDLKQAQDEGPAYLDMIQTDAAINQGNSGGALVNAKGEVIGINTFIISGSDGGNFGAGFALPIKRVKWVMDEIVQYGGLRPRVTGFRGVVLDKRWRYMLKLDDDMTGIYVGLVYPDSPASDAGLQVGDIVRAINGQLILRKQDFTRLIYEAQVGTKLHLKVQRGDEIRDTVLTISSHIPAPANKNE